MVPSVCGEQEIHFISGKQIFYCNREGERRRDREKEIVIERRKKDGLERYG